MMTNVVIVVMIVIVVAVLVYPKYMESGTPDDKNENADKNKK